MMSFLATKIQCTLAAIVISAVIGLVRNPLHAQLLIVQHPWVVIEVIFLFNIEREVEVAY